MKRPLSEGDVPFGLDATRPDLDNMTTPSDIEGDLAEDSTPFGTNLSEPSEPERSDSHTHSSLRDRYKKFYEQAKAERAKKQGLSKARKVGSEGLERLGKKAAGQAVRTGAQVAARTGAAVGTEAAAGTAAAATGVGIPVAILLAIHATLMTAKDLWQHFPLLRWIALYTGIALLMIGIILLTQGAMRILDPKHLGSDASGGTQQIPLETNRLAALASGSGGETAAQVREHFLADRKRLETAFTNNVQKFNATQISQAKAILQQMDALETQMSSAFSAGDNATTLELRKQLLTQYGELLKQLSSAIYPGAAQLRATVKALISRGAIAFTGFCPGAKRDIDRAPLTPALLNLLATMGQFAQSRGFAIHINCIKTGHRQYASSGNISDHFVGRAVDIDHNDDPRTTGELIPYLYQKQIQNPSELNLNEVIYNNPITVTEDGKKVPRPAGYYNIDNGKPVHHIFASDHTNHIHLSVKR